MFGLGAYAELSYSGILSADETASSLFLALLSDPTAERRFLVEVTPYNLADATTSTLYYSTHGFQSKSSDDPANQPFDARVITALNVERSLVRGNSLGGISPITVGEIAFNNADGGLDNLVDDYSWDGRDVRVLMGGKDFGYDDYSLIFKGTVDQLEYDLDTIRLRARDLLFKLDKPIQGSRYLGTGGNNGGADLAGKPQPLLFGDVFNIPAVLLDPANLVYHVHAGAIASIVAVRDKGVALTVTTGTPGSGSYRASTASGRFQLGATPSGRVTADVKGHLEGGVQASITSDIVRVIASTYASLTAGEVDLGSFGGVSTIAPNTVGIFIDTTDRTVRDVVEELMTGIGGFAAFNRFGQMQIGVITAPTGSNDASFTASMVFEFARESFQRPVDKLAVGYRKNYQVQTGDDLAGSVNASARSEFAQEFRKVELQATSITSTHLVPAEPIFVPGLFAEQAAASTEASRQLTIYASARSIFRIMVKSDAAQLELGNKVQLTQARYGFDSGRQLVIVGMSEDFERGEIVLELFG